MLIIFRWFDQCQAITFNGWQYLRKIRLDRQFSDQCPLSNIQWSIDHKSTADALPRWNRLTQITRGMLTSNIVTGRLTHKPDKRAESMTTPEPDTQRRSEKSSRYAAISQRLLRQAQEELDAGDTLQASEKALY